MPQGLRVAGRQRADVSCRSQIRQRRWPSRPRELSSMNHDSSVGAASCCARSKVAPFACDVGETTRERLESGVQRSAGKQRAMCSAATSSQTRVTDGAPSPQWNPRRLQDSCGIAALLNPFSDTAQGREQRVQLSPFIRFDAARLQQHQTPVNALGCPRHSVSQRSVVARRQCSTAPAQYNCLLPSTNGRQKFRRVQGQLHGVLRSRRLRRRSRERIRLSAGAL
jgi:hypothetical protein